MIKRKNSHSPPSGIKYQTYNSIRQSLQQQNLQLLRERQNIKRKSNNVNYPFNHYLNSHENIGEQCPVEDLYQGYNYQISSPIPTRQSGDKINDIYNRIEEVIDLCIEGEKDNPNETYKEIAQAEKQILGFLTNFNGSPSFNIPNSQIKTNTYHQQFNSMIKKSLLRQKIEQKGFTFDISEQLMNIIEQIQRKALSEIESLRADKLSLMKKLNEEMKCHNMERKRRQIYEGKARSLANQLKKFGITRIELPQIYEQQEEEILSSSRDRMRPTNEQNYLSNATENSNHRGHRAIQQLPTTQSYHSNIKNEIPNIVTVNSQFQIQNQINRLKNQNKQMKQTIINHKNGIPLPVKQQLKNELKNLQARSKFYENVIVNSRINNVGTSDSAAEAENLLFQGENIASEGQRLMRAKSIPGNQIYYVEFRKNMMNYQSENDISEVRKNTITSLDEDGGLIARKGKKDKSFGNQFSPGRYQRIIDEMNRITGL